MALPQNISKEHLIRAIDKIDSEGIPAGADSRYYDVLYNGRRYPPKLIVSVANLFANGSLLDRTTFPGGLETEAFKLLGANGFQIERKRGYYPQLIKFLDQSKTETLRTAGVYDREYMDLAVKVSFGQGNTAQIPWIAFLKGNQTVSNGIYPVYLYFKRQEVLILAYGVSESNPPALTWPESNLKEIKSYFAEQNLGKPDRYGTSYVFKVYNVNKPLSQKEVDSDLDEMIEKYNQVLASETTVKSRAIRAKFDYRSFVSICSESGFRVSEMLCLRYVSSLLAKPFVILTGLSGSGKTRLALAFANWICESQDQICIVPVGADWTSREPLLGYPNALEQGRYVSPDSGALQLLIRASEDKERPYFLVLDEMNLSHVERYFADFLSVMESGMKLTLHPGPTKTVDGVPATLDLPRNVFIVGTVNIDETTYMFSPKVLDRANVIEFRISTEEMRRFLVTPGGLKLEKLEGGGVSMAADFMDLKSRDFDPVVNEEVASSLIQFFSLLQETGAEFGYRTAAEISRLSGLMSTLDPALSVNEIVDVAIMQKLLPKVHGSRRKLEPILKRFASYCISDPASVDLALNSRNLIPDVKYPLTLTKIRRMYTGLVDNGFTSFAES